MRRTIQEWWNSEAEGFSYAFGYDGGVTYTNGEAVKLVATSVGLAGAALCAMFLAVILQG